MLRPESRGTLLSSRVRLSMRGTRCRAGRTRGIISGGSWSYRFVRSGLLIDDEHYPRPCIKHVPCYCLSVSRRLILSLDEHAFDVDIVRCVRSVSVPVDPLNLSLSRRLGRVAHGRGGDTDKQVTTDSSRPSFKDHNQLATRYSIIYDTSGRFVNIHSLTSPA